MRARWRRRTYPLVRPLRVASVELRERTVIELQLDDRWAELSPLPGLHREALNDLVPLLPDAVGLASATTGGYRDRLATLNDDPRWRALPPSLRCGLEGALLESVADLGRPTRPMRPTAILVDQDPGAPLEQLIGTTCAKVKIGRRPLAAEAALIRDVRRTLPDHAEIRLDANRAFTLDEAIDLASAVDLVPACIEEPLRDPAEMPVFHERTGWPLALDETLHEPGHADLATGPGVVAWVLKPARLGIHDTLAAFDRAPEDVACIVSSCFEGLVGLGLLMELAEVAPGHPAPGLGTVDWFADEGRTSRWTTIR
ncbi:hypothetical protein GF314_15510 [bacterium]|nr:hypothetical protein [bacterium]